MAILLETDELFSDGLSEMVAYVPMDEAPVMIPAIIYEGADGRPDMINLNAGVWALPLEMDFTSAFGGGTYRIGAALVRHCDIADPHYGDKIEVNGVTWRVSEVLHG